MQLLNTDQKKIQWLLRIMIIQKSVICFACEKERNRKYHAYYCNQCLYTSHIECMDSEFAYEENSSCSWTSDYVDENAEEKEVDTEYPALDDYTVPCCRKQTEIRDIRNDHIMFCHEICFSHKKQYYCCRIIYCGKAIITDSLAYFPI